MIHNDLLQLDKIISVTGLQLRIGLLSDQLHPVPICVNRPKALQGCVHHLAVSGSSCWALQLVDLSWMSLWMLLTEVYSYKSLSSWNRYLRSTNFHHTDDRH